MVWNEQQTPQRYTEIDALPGFFIDLEFHRTRIENADTARINVDQMIIVRSFNINTLIRVDPFDPCHLCSITIR